MIVLKSSARATASLAVLAAAAVPTVASAQRGAEPVTQLTASLNVRHDSNVARANAANAATRGLQRGDERATPSIDLIVSRPLGRNTLAINASAGYDFYRRNKRFNRERLSFGGQAGVFAGPIALDLGANFARRQSDPGDIAPLLTPGINSVRNTETTQDYSASARFGSSTYGLKPMASFGYAAGTNSNERRRISNYTSTRYGGGISYDGPTLGSFTLQYLRSETDYPDRPAILNQTGFNTNRIELTGRRELGAVLTASGGVSWINLKSDGAAGRSLKTVGWNLGLSAVATPDLQLTAAFARDVTPSLGTDALYQIGNNYSVGATYKMSQSNSLTLRGSIDDRTYAGAGQIFGVALTQSVQRQVSATWAIDRGGMLNGAVDVGYQQRDANGTFFDYDSFFVGIRTGIKI